MKLQFDLNLFLPKELSNYLYKSNINLTKFFKNLKLEAFEVDLNFPSHHDALLSEPSEERSLLTVSYTHLTLPTTPYV